MQADRTAMYEPVLPQPADRIMHRMRGDPRAVRVAVLGMTGLR